MTDSTISADAVLKGLEFLRDMYGPTAVDPAMQKPVRDAIALIQHQSAELQALRAKGRPLGSATIEDMWIHRPFEGIAEGDILKQMALFARAVEIAHGILPSPPQEKADEQA